MTDQQMPQPPGPDHVVPADGRPEPEPFDFDAYDKHEHLLVRDHWNDPAPRWGLARLREYTQLSDTLPGHTAESPRWQESNARVSDIREAFLEIARIKSQLAEARELAHLLLAAGTEIADDLGYLQAYDSDLAHENLPHWLTNETGAPEEWQTPDRDHEAQMDAADAVEYDPDYGKDLDYDDEDERTTDADYEVHDDNEPFEPDENDPNGGWTL